MINDLTDIFYYFLPGSFLISVALYSFWDSLQTNNFISKSGEFSVLIFLVLSLISGLFLEGLSKIWLDSPTTRIRKQEIYKINAYLFFHNRRSLPEYFSTRSAFFRNFTLSSLLSVITLTFGQKISGSTGSLIMLGLLTFFAISLKLHSLNQAKELEILENYRDDVPSDISRRSLRRV
ncbi:MAG: hypothetical protein WAP74_03815 [Patescibacteria group bacterium]